MDHFIYLYNKNIIKLSNGFETIHGYIGLDQNDIYSNEKKFIKSIKSREICFYDCDRDIRLEYIIFKDNIIYHYDEYNIELFFDLFRKHIEDYILKKDITKTFDYHDLCSYVTSLKRLLNEAELIYNILPLIEDTENDKDLVDNSKSIIDTLEIDKELMDISQPWMKDRINLERKKTNTNLIWKDKNPIPHEIESNIDSMRIGGLKYNKMLYYKKYIKYKKKYLILKNN